MIMNDLLRAHMSKATRALMSGGVQAATAAIQDALKDLPGHVNNGNAMPHMSAHMPEFMRNIHLKSGKSLNESSASGVINGRDGMPDFVTDLLARLGVPASQDGWKLDQNLWNPEPWAQPIAEPEADTKSGGQFLTKSFTNQAGTRDYKVYIPSSYHGQSMPLMVMLHGCTQNPDDFARGTRMNALAEEKQCFVVYPAQTQSANSSKCWNWFKAVDQQRDQGEPSIIAGITRQVISDYKLDSKHVYVAGLSSGGAMAIIMGTTYPDLYAAVGVHSGLPYGAAQDLPSAFSAMRGAIGNKTRTANARLDAIPIIVFHGDRDTTVNVSNGEHLMQQNVSGERAHDSATSSRINPDVIVQEGKVPNGHGYTRTSHHDENGNTMAEHWVIHGAGHAWAGGSRSGSYTDPKGPDASGEMMRFFYTQTKPLQKKADD
jgi:poly(hydroxyalkanoate) depolymerase family esterase